MNIKQEYLSYFKPKDQQHKPDKKLILQRPKTSQYKLTKTQKLLPHVTEEYQYRITNELLEYKINHPRRDKIIVEAVSSAQPGKSASIRQKRRVVKIKTEEKENKLQEELKTEGEQLNVEGSRTRLGGKRSNIERLYKTFDDLNSPCNNYMNDYLISLENNRMGKRLINTRSMVQDMLTKTYYTYKIYNGKIVNRDKFVKINRNSIKFRSCNKNFGKINNGIKSFFQKVIRQSKKHSSEHGLNTNSSFIENQLNKTVLMESKDFRSIDAQLNHHGLQTNNPGILEAHGTGEYNIVISKLIILSNPPIKPETNLIIQVIEKQHKLADVLNNYYSQKNNFFKSHCKTEVENNGDCFTSASFPYEYISGQKSGFGIKFRVHKRKQIFLRLIKIEGIDQRQVGIVKINLSPFYSLKEEQFPFTVFKQKRQINGSMHERDVFMSEHNGQLFRFKKGYTTTQIHLEYYLYRRKFSRVDGEHGEQVDIQNIDGHEHGHACDMSML